jgi:hypothetical protein
MAGGAVVAAAAAAHAKRVQTILDAFRVAGATAPERAQPLEQLGLERNTELEELIRHQVLVAASRADEWYLSESAYIARRDSATQSARRILAFVLALALALAIFAIAFYRGGSAN